MEDDETGRACSTCEMISSYKTLFRKPERKSSLGKPMPSWEG
jgi:hypothetical protein